MRNRTRKHFAFCISLFLALSAGAAGLPAEPGEKKKKASKKPTPLEQYVARARQTAVVEPATIGSLWAAGGRFTELAIDHKSRHAGDLIVIRIIERTTADAQGSVQTDRTFEASSGISGLFGNVGPASGLQNLFSPTSSRSLDGQGQTSSQSRLQTLLAGYVVEVLPNGNLVVEAQRSIEMNNEQQTILVRGVVRPSDIGPDNSIFSTSISALEVELKGKGVISDGTRPPNRIVRILLRILGF